MLRVTVRAVLSSALSVFVLFAGGGVAAAQDALTPGDARAYATIYSIGVEWDVAGDGNHNAAATVEYRVQGAVAWTPALPLMRIDNGSANMLAGSVLFLTPATPYDIRVALTDPDGGAETRVVSVATRPLPALPSGGRTLHVVSGKGSGDGSAQNPFKGIAAAQLSAQPGDILLLHAGSYGGRVRFDKSGTPAQYLVWKAYGDGEVLMNGIDIAASNIWLEGITVRNQAYATFSINAPQNVVVSRCRFFNNHYSIYLQQGGSGWYIADNTIVGDTPYGTESFDGEGIELNVTSGHTVAHNSITNVADGISYPLANVDIFGNDIFDTSDDGIEADNGTANVRMWQNRIHNAVHNGISFQPQSGGPWYIIRNQIVSNAEAAFKFRTTDRFVLLHNTIVNWGTAWPADAMMCCNEGHLLRAFARNNLWVSVQGGQIWGFDEAAADWRTSLDADGFDWGSAANPFAYGGVTYPDLASFAAASGLETRGIRISHADCFETFDVPSPPIHPVPPQAMTLRGGCNAVDAGVALANVNDGRVAGAAPDMGAYEYGRPAPGYGPRIEPTVQLTVAPTVISAGGSATLSWSSTDATSVTIDQSIGSVPPSGSATVAPGATTTYTATATGAHGIASAAVTLTVATPPAAPGNLTASPLSPTKAVLAWRDNSDGETGFVLERSSDTASWRQVALPGADATTYTDSTVQRGKTYFYRIKAAGAAGDSAYSNTASVTMPKK